MKIQETLFKLEPIQEVPEEEYKEKYVIGGIYVYKDCNIDNDPELEVSISLGRGLHLLYDGIFHIDADVEIGGLHMYKQIPYALRINKKEMTWRIVDTGTRNCKHELCSGSFVDGFYESIQPLLKAFHK